MDTAVTTLRSSTLYFTIRLSLLLDTMVACRSLWLWPLNNLLLSIALLGVCGAMEQKSGLGKSSKKMQKMYILTFFFPYKKE